MKKNKNEKKNEQSSEPGRRRHPAKYAAATAVASLLASGAASFLATRHASEHDNNPDASPLDIGADPLGYGSTTIGGDTNLGWQEMGHGISLPGAELKLGFTHESDKTIDRSLAITKRGQAEIFGDITHKEEHTETTNTETEVETAARIAERLITHTEKVVLEDIYMEWARLFSADPESDNTVRDGVVAEAANRIIELSKTGKILEITCTGYASDEDDYSDTHPETTNPGFGIPSQKNVDLATKRGAVVTSELAGLLHEQLPGVPVINTTGEEIIDTAQSDTIVALAMQKGENPVELVKRFNRGSTENFTEEELQLLDGLRDDRFVRCIVKVQRLETEIVITRDETTSSTRSTETTDSSENGGGVVIVRTPDTLLTEGGSHQEKTKSGYELIVVLIPVVIPIFPVRLRRRTPGEPLEPVGDPEPPITPLPPEGDPLPPGDIIVVPPPPPPPPPPPRLELTQKEMRERARMTPLVKSRTDTVQGHRKQPRNHNYSGRPQYLGGRMPRSHGGNRRSKRG